MPNYEHMIPESEVEPRWRVWDVYERNIDCVPMLKYLGKILARTIVDAHDYAAQLYEVPWTSVEITGPIDIRSSEFEV